MNMDLDSVIRCPASHRINHRENWLNGKHCSGVMCCVNCGSSVRYDITFNVDPWVDVKFSERVDGEWRYVDDYEKLQWGP